MNDRIRISPIKVVSQEGTMLGEMPTPDALRMASEAGLDLVEVSPEARPPICRIMDFGKVQYEQKKKQGNSSKSRVQLKPIRLRAKIGQHDIDFKVRKARDFLRRKHKLKINVLFRGRENAHHERGRELLTEVVELLEDIATVEQPIKMEGRRAMSVMLSPSKSGSN
jgi:translation initiation factor IF-3